ncbi:MAG: hypothetical protein IJS01_14510 [Lentisphaeria bacterium]|nr:hypothetical protein [Lentisphaeria bacterium]
MMTAVKTFFQNKILLYVMSRYVTMGLQFLSSIYIAKRLGPHHWGEWSFMVLLINIGTTLDWGIANSINILLTQHLKEPRKNAVFCYNALILSLFIMIPVVLVTFYDRIFGIRYFSKFDLGGKIYLILLIICVNYLNSLFVNISRVRNRILPIAISQSSVAVVSCVLMFFAVSGKLLTLLIWGYAFAVLFSLGVFLTKRDIDWSVKFDWTTAGTIARKGIFLFCYNGSFALIAMSTKTIISYFYPVKNFGFFSFAFSLANATMLLVNSLIFIATPRMIKMLDGDDKSLNMRNIELLRRCYLLCINAIVYLSIPCYLLVLLLVPKYQPSTRSFIMIEIALSMYPVCYGYNTFLLAHNREKNMASMVGIALLINVAATWFLAAVLRVQMEYCAIGIAFSYLANSVMTNLFAARVLGTPMDGKTVLRFIPLYSLVPLVITLYIVYADRTGVWWMLLPFAVFCLFGMKDLLAIKPLLVKLIKKPEIINV